MNELSREELIKRIYVDQQKCTIYRRDIYNLTAKLKAVEADRDELRLKLDPFYKDKLLTDEEKEALWYNPAANTYGDSKVSSPEYIEAQRSLNERLRNFADEFKPEHTLNQGIPEKSVIGGLANKNEPDSDVPCDVQVYGEKMLTRVEADDVFEALGLDWMISDDKKGDE